MKRITTRRKIGDNLYSVRTYCLNCGELLCKEKEEIIPQTFINMCHKTERVNEQNWHRVWRGLTVVAYVCDKCFEQYMKDNPRYTSDAKNDYFKKDVVR